MAVGAHSHGRDQRRVEHERGEAVSPSPNRRRPPATRRAGDEQDPSDDERPGQGAVRDALVPAASAVAAVVGAHEVVERDGIHERAVAPPAHPAAPPRRGSATRWRPRRRAGVEVPVCGSDIHAIGEREDARRGAAESPAPQDGGRCAARAPARGRPRAVCTGDHLRSSRARRAVGCSCDQTTEPSAARRAKRWVAVAAITQPSCASSGTMTVRCRRATRGCHRGRGGRAPRRQRPARRVRPTPQAAVGDEVDPPDLPGVREAVCRHVAGFEHEKHVARPDCGRVRRGRGERDGGAGCGGHARERRWRLRVERDRAGGRGDRNDEREPDRPPRQAR
jgi:hypothetical protein